MTTSTPCTLDHFTATSMAYTIAALDGDRGSNELLRPQRLARVTHGVRCEMRLANIEVWKAR